MTSLRKATSLASGPLIVAIGGGSGPPLLARAFADQLPNFTAVVCTSDRGGSSGMCRRAFRIPAPGDIRATLSTLAELSGQKDWAELWETRLHSQEMESTHGMALGNLLISGLVQRMGDLTEAVKRAQALLGLQGSVLPVTPESVDIEAELEDGAIVQGELEVRRPNKPLISRLGWVGSAPSTTPGVLEALGRADLIVIGPGCLYTSILPCLLVNGVSEAIRKSKALSAYICNTTTTPGQSEELSVAAHVEVVWQILGGEGLDSVVINVEEPPMETREAYEAIGVSLLLPTEEDLRAIESMGIRATTKPILEKPRPHPRNLHKVDTIRHNPAKLRSVLDELIRTIIP